MFLWRVGAGGPVELVLDGDGAVAAGLAFGDDMAVGGTGCGTADAFVVGVDEAKVRRHNLMV